MTWILALFTHMCIPANVNLPVTASETIELVADFSSTGHDMVWCLITLVLVLSLALVLRAEWGGMAKTGTYST